jgi:ABC-type lipoprotein export system ATPase subunit
MTAPSISLQLQHKSVGKQRILGAMNIEIAAQQVVALRGPSGAGKSSLLAILSTLDSQFDGALHLLGNDMTRTSESKRARFRAQHMGFVFQVPRLIAGFDGAANLRIHGHDVWTQT